MKIYGKKKEISTLLLLFTQEELEDLCYKLENMKEKKINEIKLEYKDDDGRFCKHMILKLR